MIGGRRRLAELAERRVNPFARALDGGGRVSRFPDRRDREQRIGEPVEHEDHRGPHEQHIGQFERAVRRARQGFDQSDGLVAEIAHETGQRRRQAFGHGINPAGRRQIAQRGERVAVARRKSRAVLPPVAVDLGCGARGPEHQIWIEPEQAVAPAHLAALDRFEQEIAAPGHDQPPRRAHRRVAVGDNPPPHQRRPALGQHSG